MEAIILRARDGYALDVHVFPAQPDAAASANAAGSSVAVIQLIHGMEEHQERYEPFIRELNANGFSVVSSNLRGHGSNAPELGFFQAKNGDQELLEDQRTIAAYIRERFPGMPLFLFAHSMGTIIARVLLQEDSHRYQKVVLSGYPNYQSGARFGIWVANGIQALRGPRYRSKFITKLSIKPFNQAIPNPKTDCDWICRNEQTVQAYLADPYCGIGFTCSAFRDLFRLVIRMHQPGQYHQVNRDLQLLLLRGLEDPCTGGDAGARDSYQTLQSAGFAHIQTIEYPDMRHEILAETDCLTVYRDILAFYQQ